MVVEVLPAQCQAIHALAQHVPYSVLDQQRAAWVGDATCRRIQQSELAVNFAQQHHSAIAGHAATVKTAFDHPSAQTAKVHGFGGKFFGTVWHWQSQL